MRWPNNWRLGAAVIIALSGVMFAWMQAIPTFADPDSFYHARFTALMLQHGLITDFPWLPFTTLGQAFADHHLLYHILLMPAVYALGPIVGIKVTQALLGVTLVAVGYGILRRWKVPYAAPAMLLLFSVYPMLVRMNLAKASVLAVILFLLILVALVERRFAWAAVLTVIYSLSHGGFFLAGVLAVVVWIAECVVQLVARKKFVPPLPTGIIMVTLAMVLGVLCNPYFPSNIPFLWAQFFQIGVVNYQSVIQVGAEWYPYLLPNLVGVLSTLLIGGVGVVAVTILRWRQVLTDRRMMTLFLLVPIFFVLTLRSRRFVEYLVPVLWLTICLGIVPAIQQGLLAKWWQKARQLTGRATSMIAVYLVGAIAFALLSVYPMLHKEFTSAEPLTQYAAASAYLASVTEPGATIFHGQWDDFPALFFYNPEAAYIAGLDPTFLYLADLTLYTHWHDISTGVSKQQTAADIRQYFQARYVVVNTTEDSSKLMLAYLLRDPSAHKVFSQEGITVFDLGNL